MTYLIILSSLILSLVGCQSSLTKTVSAQKTIQVQGHRGSRGTHPENSLPAFEEAFLAGADWIELDLVLSKEDIPLVSHDPVVSVDLCVDAQKKPLSRVIPIKLKTI
ncbi:MAG: glycerophosphodiester phosphodiesterase family protein, partial [Pseudomonadota bacterium]